MSKGKQSEIGENQPTEKSGFEMESLVDDVLGEQPKSEEQPKEEELTDVSEGLEEEEVQEEEKTPDEDSTDQEEEESKESEGLDEDVVPKSKYEKTLEKMQKRIDQLTAERKAAQNQENSSKQTQEQKLQSLSNAELEELADNVDDAILDAKVAQKTEGEDMSSKINELKTLKKQIASTMKNAPQRFQQKQLSHLKDMIETVKEVDPGITNMKGDLWNIAKAVYTRMPSLHNSETGQAEALALATEHYVALKSGETGKKKVNELSRKVTDLKRKTSLDVKNRNGDANVVTKRNLRDKAIKGTYDDKLAFVKNTLVPDDFLKGD